MTKNIVGRNLKNIAVNLSAELVEDVLLFHSKANLMIDNKFINRMQPYPFNKEQFEELEFSDFEISPFHDAVIACEPNRQVKIRRHRSAKHFDTGKVDFATVKKLLSASFAMRRDRSRPYPSGGAFYPVEVICVIFSEKLLDAPASGYYHYRPSHNYLQPLRHSDSDDIRKMLYQLELPDTTSPAFAFIYLGVLGKMLVKYRYRGYRYALMETGSMYHQADLASQALGLRNKLYSGFNDQELIKRMGLDNMTFLPLVVQSFGASPCK
jgi:SagB-type dehydrogenase family enzyme